MGWEQNGVILSKEEGEFEYQGSIAKKVTIELFYKNRQGKDQLNQIVAFGGCYKDLLGIPNGTEVNLKGYLGGRKNKAGYINNTLTATEVSVLTKIETPTPSPLDDDFPF